MENKPVWPTFMAYNVGMDYGNKPHKHSPEDLTILYCGCGWRSEEMTKDQVVDLGLPWYCGRCNKKNLRFIKFHPSERDEALRRM